MKRYILLAVLLLSACTTPMPIPGQNVDAQIAAGIISPINIEAVYIPEITTSQVVEGHVHQNLDFSVEIIFPRTYHLHFEAETITQHNASISATAWDYGYFSGIGVRLGNSVSYGQFIAELSYSPTEAVQIARHALELERQQFEQNFTAQNTQHLNTINQETDPLRRQRAQAYHRQFIADNNTRRENFVTRLEDINQPIETERLYSPADGRVTFTTQHFHSGFFRDVISMSGTGGNPPTGRRVVSIVDETYKHFVVEAPLYALRYGDILPVFRQGGEAYFLARVSTDPLTDNIPREGIHRFTLTPLEGEFDKFLNDVEAELGANFDPDTIIGLLTLRIRPVIERSHHTTIVDRRAITTEGQNQFVLLYDNGSVGRRYILPGAQGVNDGQQVTEILAGVTPGQWVVIP